MRHVIVAAAALTRQAQPDAPEHGHHGGEHAAYVRVQGAVGSHGWDLVDGRLQVHVAVHANGEQGRDPAVAVAQGYAFGHLFFAVNED